MIDERSRRGEQYLLQLHDGDLALLAQGESELRDTSDPAQAIRARPELIEGLLARPSSFEAVFGSIEEHAALHLASPFLLFAVCVHRTAGELEHANFVTEWFGPRQRMPVFDVAGLREFLADYGRRLYLAQLLASYTHVASGSVLVSTRRGLRRQRFSELDITRLASICQALPDADRSPIYRRLGDLALFLTGVFPDHTATQGFSQIDEARLLRSVGLRPGQWSAQTLGLPEGRHSAVVELLEQLGARWYKAASEWETASTSPGPSLRELSTRFRDARRVLNVLTDSFLFPWRSRWFGIGSS